MPYLFDHPVEEAVDWAFGTALRVYGGEDAVRPLPAHARSVSEGESLGVAQLSWEEYKNQRQIAREERKGVDGGILSWFGGKEKDE